MTALVAQLARELGFARAAVIPVEAPRRHELYASWLERGHAGDMTYLASPSHVEARGDLRVLLADATALIVVALAYHRDDPIPPAHLVRTPARSAVLASAAHDSAAHDTPSLRGRIARYARGEDYHLVMRDRLVMLAQRLADALGEPVATRPCVDSAPVLEREWAERAGLGFIAKNTMLIAPGLGSYVVLGELLIATPPDRLGPLAADAPPRPRCGSCRACLDACPTQAFVDAYVLDARRCISYLTIEHHGVIARELRAAMGTWVFGCDVCQEVCPFNAGTGEPGDPALAPRTMEHALPDLVELASKGANQLRRFVKRTAMRRVPREVLMRNVAIALGNTGDPAAIPALVALTREGSPLIRGHAVWALHRLGDDPRATAALDELRGREADAFVRDELSCP